MLRAEGIRIPESKEPSLFHRFYIAFRVWAFLPSVGNVGWSTTTTRLKITEQRPLLLCHAWTTSRQNPTTSVPTTSRYRSVLLRFSSLWVYYTSLLCIRRVLFNTLQYQVEDAHKMQLSTYMFESCRFQRTDFNFHFP